MADRDFNVKIVTTADTAGIQQTDAELRKLEARQASLRAQVSQVPIGLTGEPPGQYPPARPGQYPSPEQDEDDRLLSRRTLTFAIAGGYAIQRAISEVTKQIEEMTAKLNKAGEDLVSLGKSWNEQANTITTPEGMANLAEKILPKIQSSQQAVNDENMKALPLWQQMLDAAESVTHFYDKNYVPTFEKQRRERVNQLQDMATAERNAGERSIRTALETKREWDKLSKLPVEDAIAAVTEKLRRLKVEQDGIGPEMTESWALVGSQIATANKELALLQARLKSEGPTTPLLNRVPSGQTLTEALKQATIDQGTLTPLQQTQLRNKQISDEAYARKTAVEREGEIRDAQAQDLKDTYEKGFEAIPHSHELELRARYAEEDARRQPNQGTPEAKILAGIDVTLKKIYAQWQ